MNTSFIESTDYSSAFEIALSFVLAMEGGFVDDPDDPGGMTRYGISQRAYPDLDIRHLTQAQASAIYYQDYWQPCQCDHLPVATACVLFDTAVNMGQGTAIKLLQQSVNTQVDGVIGQQTIAACFRERCAHYLPDMLSRRAKRYHQIAQDEKQSRFFRGWMRRLFELQQRLHEERLL